MTMKSEIIDAIKRSGGAPMTSDEIIEQVHQQSGISWKRSSIRKALGTLVTNGQVVNLCRDPETGVHVTSPCTYGAAS
ncbi:helix-turn-helix DNA binding domain protein [Microbacterium phage SadLad]|nr:helix-turn-helix DNA binding domain protein [Microbacterium phage SadLad]